MESRLKAAYQFASEAHEGQKRKDTGDDYFTHPIRVSAAVCAYAGSTVDMAVAAMLHDVLEDTKVTLEQLEERFGTEVANLCVQLTNPSVNLSPHDGTRAKRKEMDREYLATVSREAKIIKLFDRIDNVIDIRKVDPKRMDWALMYLEESWLLAEVLKDADEKLYRTLLETIDGTAEFLFCTSDRDKLAELKERHKEIRRNLEKEC